jgi:hypothetical protein
VTFWSLIGRHGLRGCGAADELRGIEKEHLINPEDAGVVVDIEEGKVPAALGAARRCSSIRCRCVAWLMVLGPGLMGLKLFSPQHVPGRQERMNGHTEHRSGV